MKTFLFLAQGFEETEAVGTIDVLVRGGLEVMTVSITGNNSVTGAHGISVTADKLFEETNFSQGTILVLPGGMPGTNNLNAHKGLKILLKQYYDEGKLIAAICAAPLILGGLYFLKNKRAVIYPGFETTLIDSVPTDANTVKDGNIITSRGPGFVFDFGLTIVAELLGQKKANEIAAEMLLIPNTEK